MTGKLSFQSKPVPLVLFTLLLVITGCKLTMSRSSSQPEEKIHSSRDLALTPEQLRLRIRALVGPLCGRIEQTADSIIAGTTNQVVQKEALRWKIEGMTAMREALFQPDPFTAAMDTWVLCYQMADYFEIGPGRSRLRLASENAAITYREIEEEYARILAGATISGDVSVARAFARQWAAEHPIRHSIAGRETALSRIMERDASNAFSPGDAVGEITTTMDDLNRRMQVYSDQLLRQARWEAELFRRDLMDDFPRSELLELADTTTKTIDDSTKRALALIEDIPTVITSEREAASSDLRDELVRILQFIHEERIAAFAQLSQERIASARDASEIISRERQALHQELEIVSAKTVDRAMLRVLQLLAVAFLLLILTGLFGVYLVRRLFSFQRPAVPSV